MSPTARSLKYLRDKGYTAAVVEKWNPHARIRQDFCGFADIIAFKGWNTDGSEQGCTYAIQSTTTGNISKRLEKIVQSVPALIWQRCEGRGVIIHGWSKKGPRGKRKVWTLTERYVYLSDFKQ